MIISRYLLREIVGPLAVVLGVLAVLFTSYGAASFLSDAVNGLLPMDMIVQGWSASLFQAWQQWSRMLA